MSQVSAILKIVFGNVRLKLQGSSNFNSQINISTLTSGYILFHTSIFEMVETAEDSPFPLTDLDKWILSQTDEEFQLHTWEELKDVVGEWKQKVKSGV